MKIQDSLRFTPGHIHEKDGHSNEQLQRVMCGITHVRFIIHLAQKMQPNLLTFNYLQILPHRRPLPSAVQNAVKLILRPKKKTSLFSFFILVMNQLDAQNFFYNKFISCLYMFRAHVLIVRRSKLYHTASGIITTIGGRLVYRTATYRCDDTRCCIIQFWPPDDEHMVFETCRGMK